MKKIIIVVSLVVVLCFTFFCIFVSDASKDHNKKLKEIEADFLKTHKNVKIVEVYPYHGTKTYYIVDYKDSEDEYISILNYDGSITKSVVKSKLCDIDKDVKIGYENLDLVYEEIVKEKKKITYNYYDAFACKKINEIVLEK